MNLRISRRAVRRNRRSRIPMLFMPALLATTWPVAGSMSARGPRVTESSRDRTIRVLDDTTNITSLVIKITTSDDWFAGTDNEVWFDIGPTAWKLDGSFDRGSTRTIALDVTRPGGDPLKLDDIRLLRLEKKGINGWTDAPDSYIDPLLPSGRISPAQLVDEFQKQVSVAKYAVSRANAALDEVNKLVDVQDKAIQGANDLLNEASNDLRQLPGQIAGVENSILSTQARLAQTPLNVLKDVPIPGICTGKKKILGATIPVAYPCIQTIKQTVANGLIDELKNTIVSLAKQKNDLEAHLATATIDQQTAIRNAVVAQGLRADAIARRATATAAVTAANATLDTAQKALAEAQKMAANLPGIDIDVPRPNQWKPEKMTVVVNGQEFAAYGIDHRLKQGQSSWMRLIQSADGAEQFVERLRINPNGQSKHSDEYIAGASTVFKNLGISGWQGGPIGDATVEGTLIHPPSVGTDGYVSLDLEVFKVTAGRRLFGLRANTFDENSGASKNHKHYVRIEYAHNDGKGHDDHRFEQWKVGDRFRVSGPVRWDTDKYGFFELHPTGPGQVSTIE